MFFAVKTGDVVAKIVLADNEQGIGAPISGSVVEVNLELDSRPRLVLDDPYGIGWLFRLKIEAGEEIEHLLSASAYLDYVRLEENLDVESP